MNREERPVRKKQQKTDRDSRMSRNSGSKDSGERVRNKEFARVTYFFVILFIALMGYLVYFMVVRAKTCSEQSI